MSRTFPGLSSRVPTKSGRGICTSSRQPAKCRFLVVRQEKWRTPRNDNLLRVWTWWLVGAAALAVTLLYGAPAAAQPPQKVRAERYEIDVTFRPEQSFLRAKASVTVAALEQVDAIEFELNPRLEIDQVTDAAGRALEVIRSGRLGSSKLLVRLAEPCPAKQSVTVTFSYRGTLDFRGGLDYISRDGILLRDETRWYPVVDLASFTLNDITFRLPLGWSAVASGNNVNEPGARAQGVVRWKSENPVSSRAVTAFPVSEQKDCIGMLPLSHGTGPTTSTCLKPAFQQRGEQLRQTALDVLTTFEKLLGKYAQENLGLNHGFPGTQGAAGYSAPGFMVISEDVAKWFDNPGIAPEFLAHEIAHQWFPLQVTLESEADGLLAESVAEYLAWRYLLEKNPEQARAMVERAMRDALEPEPLRPLSAGLQLFATEDWNVTQATLYDRGLLVFRTLETVIGRSRVDAALREYYKRFSGRSASIADFRKICEETSERDLGWFFDYFLNGTKIPELELRRLPAAPGDFAGEIVLKNVPPEFTARVEMRIHTPKGSVEHSVATRGEVTPFTVNVPAPATGFTLDPDLRILRWTEAARRHRHQRELLAELGDLERAHQFSAAIRRCEQALADDADDLARNHQQIQFQLGRLYLRRGLADRAQQHFSSALELVSIDRGTTDFYRAWSHVFRARLAASRADTKAARAEAEAGMALKSPALETIVTWPDAPLKKSSAREELSKYLR